jgi:hypothetical protein
MVRFALVALFAAAAVGQVPQVVVTGSLQVDLQPSSGPVVTRSLPVLGAATLAVPGVASAQAVVGASSSLLTTALSPPFSCSGCWSSASGDLRFAWHSAVPIAGRLQLQVVPACFMVQPPFADVHDDGAWEAHGGSGVVTVDVPLVLGSAPVVVRVAGNSVNFGSASCQGSVVVAWQPQPGALATVGTGCGPDLGASLTGSAARSLVLSVGGANGVLAAIGLGGPPTAAMACAPVAVPVAALWVVPQANLRVVLPIAAAVHGSFTLQYVELLGDGSLAFSNGIAALL